MVEVADERPVLGVDTAVVLRGRVFGKPTDAADAERMLEELSGTTHVVVSGVCLLTRGWEELGHESTRVSFRELSPRELGVYVGTYCQPMIPSLYQPVADPMETIRTIREIGPDRCIIGSDFGQVLHMDAVDGMRVFIRALLGFGIKPDEVKVMLKDNPAKLMWLDE